MSAAKKKWLAKRVGRAMQSEKCISCCFQTLSRRLSTAMIERTDWLIAAAYLTMVVICAARTACGSVHESFQMAQNRANLVV